MRTLLTESRPPGQAEEKTLLRSEAGLLHERTFSEEPVLASPDDLLEVGVEGMVVATPGASNIALERGSITAAQQSADGLPRPSTECNRDA